MRFGTRRGAILAMALGATAAMALAPGSALAIGNKFHTIPREVPAVDYRTGDVMYAPPIPYGEYAKDYAGTVHEWAGMAAGAAHAMLGKVCSLCGLVGCGACMGSGHLADGSACGACGGDGCTNCDGHGHNLLVDPTSGSGLGIGKTHGWLSGHGHDGGVVYGGSGCGVAGCDGFGLKHKLAGHGRVGGLLSSQGLHGQSGSLCGPGMNCASAQSMPSAQVLPTGQALPSGQGLISAPCNLCGGKGLFGGSRCGTCSGHGLYAGRLCGGCGGKGLIGAGLCHGCGGNGLTTGLACGACKGSGLFGGHACGTCGGKGLMAGGSGANVCPSCGGKGCAACGGTGLVHALAGHLVGSVGMIHGAVSSAAATVLHKGDIEYFVGPGGPVPLTPGYVPYVVPVRSPRDYFAFPPFSDRAQP